MELTQKMELINDLLEVEEGELSLDTELSSLENWDSMTRLSLIVMMDEDFDKELTGDVVRSFKTVKDIVDFMG